MTGDLYEKACFVDCFDRFSSHSRRTNMERCLTDSQYNPQVSGHPAKKLNETGETTDTNYSHIHHLDNTCLVGSNPQWMHFFFLPSSSCF